MPWGLAQLRAVIIDHPAQQLLILRGGRHERNDDMDDYEVKIRDKNLADRIRLVDTLEEDDRKAIIQVVDSMLTKKKMLDLLTNQEELIFK